MEDQKSALSTGQLPLMTVTKHWSKMNPCPLGVPFSGSRVLRGWVRIKRKALVHQVCSVSHGSDLRLGWPL